MQKRIKFFDYMYNALYTIGLVQRHFYKGKPLHRNYTPPDDSVIEVPRPAARIPVIKEFIENSSERQSEDFFLYSCWEALKAAPNITKFRHKYCSPFINQSRSPEGEKQDFLQGLDSKQDQLNKIVDWYLNQTPELGQENAINYENVNAIINPFIGLSFEIKELFSHYPAGSVNAGAEEESNDAGDETPSQPQEQEIQGLKPFAENSDDPSWLMIIKTLESKLSIDRKYIIAYFQWIFGNEHYFALKNTSSIPPIGKFAPPVGTKFLPDDKVLFPNRMRKFLKRREELLNLAPALKKRTDRSDERPSDSKPHLREVKKDSSEQRSDSYDRSENRSERQHSDRPQHSDRSPSDRSPSDRSQSAEIEALKDVIAAIESLKNDPELPSVRLKPANSFYRRMQHKEVDTAGFESSSEGEGKERCLVVSRPSDA